MIPVLIQSNNPSDPLRKMCIKSLMEFVSDKGFYIVVIDIHENEDLGFVGNIQRYLRLNPGVVYYMIGFDDLCYDACDFLSANDYIKFMDEYHAGYLRVDGRPPFDGEEFCIKNNVINKTRGCNMKYHYSTVNAIFHRGFLDECGLCDSCSAWDIENMDVCDGIGAYSFRYRTSRYHNLLVKGRLDPFALIESGVSISMFDSLKRLMVRRFLNVIYQYSSLVSSLVLRILNR